MNQFTQVFINLVQNIIDAMEARLIPRACSPASASTVRSAGTGGLHPS